jgi:hypothetical protein
MTPLSRFLHHLAAFTLVAALVVEFVIRDDLTIRTARKLQIADPVFGIAAGVVLVIGLLRVFILRRARHTTCTAFRSSQSSACLSLSRCSRSIQRSEFYPGEKHSNKDRLP